MGGHHEIKFPEVPDFRKYRVEDVPVLMETQKKLARFGLRDPWLRNEVWKYQVDGAYDPSPRKLIQMLSKGLKGGIALAVIMTAVSKTFKRSGEHH